MKRKKRLQKGIESITESIEQHIRKLETARKEGNVFLAEYLEKEIEQMRMVREKMRRIVQKK